MIQRPCLLKCANPNNPQAFKVSLHVYSATVLVESHVCDVGDGVVCSDGDFGSDVEAFHLCVFLTCTIRQNWAAISIIRMTANSAIEH